MRISQRGGRARTSSWIEQIVAGCTMLETRATAEVALDIVAHSQMLRL